MSLDSKVPQRAAAGEPISDVLRASRLNQVPDAIEDIKRYLQDTEVPGLHDNGRVQFWIGEIVDKGPRQEADFTNATYWVKMISVAPGQGADLAFEDEPIPGVGGVFPVTNVEEVKDKTHTLRPGERVFVFYPWNSKQEFRLFFIRQIRRGEVGLITGSSLVAFGTYVANLLTPPTPDRPAGATLTTADFGVVGESIIIINAKEINQNTHDLTDPANTDDLVCQITYLCTNASGTKVYMTDKIWIGCEDGADIDDGGP